MRPETGRRLSALEALASRDQGPVRVNFPDYLTCVVDAFCNGTPQGIVDVEEGGEDVK